MNPAGDALDLLDGLPLAALRLLAPLGGGALLCLVLLILLVVADPYAAMPRAVRDNLDPVPVAAVNAPAAPVPAGSTGSLGLQAVAWARAQEGKPYVWGAAGPDSFDCSGLMQWAWARAGVRIPKFTVDQYDSMQPVAVPELQAGDLVFLEYTYPADYRITHVGMFTERRTVIEAPEPGVAIREVPFARYTATRFFGAARPKVQG